jgi:drug/metabolite transporter (DMT)-like permease
VTGAAGRWGTVALTGVAMLAFAANSLLCRMALQHDHIDAASFSSVRLASGALALAVIARLRGAAGGPARPGWAAAAALFGYVVLFSFAYRSLGAGTGALILFGAVQLTMFAAGLRAGERFVPWAWAGFVLAVAGLVWLVAPGLAAPPPVGAVLMAGAGVAWGAYSLLGRRAGDALSASAGNFLRATPLALLLSAVLAAHAHATPAGLALAAASGALTSGIGYVIWYAALKGLSALRAATVQLSVPPIAALSGAWLLGEAITPRLVGASITILGGIALVLTARARGSR